MLRQLCLQIDYLESFLQVNNWTLDFRITLTDDELMSIALPLGGMVCVLVYEKYGVVKKVSFEFGQHLET